MVLEPKPVLRTTIGAAVSALALAASVAALAASQGPPAPAAAGPLPPKALVPVAASTLAANPDAYAGEFVTITGAVEQTFGSTSFSVDQDKTKSTGKDVLVITQALYGPITANTYVTAIGEVMKYDTEAIAKKNPNYKTDLPADALLTFKGKPVVLAYVVVNDQGIDIAKKPLAPPTTEEAALGQIMKAIGGANGALRKGIEGSSADTVKAQAAVVRKGFLEIEAFWKAKGKADAMGWAADGTKILAGIDAAVTAGTWDEVKASAANLGKTCQSCHGAYRQQVEDGTYRIKQPTPTAGTGR